MARYFDTEVLTPGAEPKILVRVLADPSENPLLAVVDTAAPWCIFNKATESAFLQSLELVPGPAILSTRIGMVRGALYRGQLTLPADEGESLDIDATVFVTPDWPGPNFLGYRGFLQRIRFAVDPESNLFYFGRI